MKNYIAISLCLVFVLSSLHLSAQIKAKQAKVQYSTKDKFQDYTFDVMEKGVYTVTIMDPAGGIISKPTYQKEFEAGKKIKTKLNSKYWRPGDYYVLVEKDEQVVDSYRINVVIDREAQMKKEKARFARKTVARN